MFKNIGLLTASQVGSQAMILLRTMILARILAPDDMGKAALFISMISLFEMGINLDAGTFLVQSNKGNQKKLQDVVHSFQLLRGVLSGLLIFSIAPFVVKHMGLESQLWAFQIVALIPIVRGVSHLDWRRSQRHMHYRQTITFEVWPQVITTLLALPVALYFKDYKAMVVLLFVHTLASVAISHLVAIRPYRIGFNKIHARSLLIFGWPLLLLGWVQYAITQGDRFLVGTFYSMSDLGLYAVVLAVIQALVLAAAKLNGHYLLPLAVKFLKSDNGSAKPFSIGADLLVATSLMLSVLFLFLGNNLIQHLFGNQYFIDTFFSASLALWLFARLVRLPSVALILANGDTNILLYSSTARIVGSLTAVLFAWLSFPLPYIVLSLVMGEMLCLIIELLVMNRRLNVIPHDYRHSLFLSLTTFSLILLIYAAYNTTAINNLASFITLVFFILLSLSLFFYKSRNLPEIVKQFRGNQFKYNE